MRSTPLILLTLALGVSVHAAPAFLDRHSLTLDGARQVIAAAAQQTRQVKAAGVIAVVDSGGNLMALERLDGTFAAGTAALFQKPTKHRLRVISPRGKHLGTIFTPM